MLDLSSIALEEIAGALADQVGYEHRWLINRTQQRSGSGRPGTGIDGQAPVELDELVLVAVDPLGVLGLVSAHGRLRRWDNR